MPELPQVLTTTDKATEVACDALLIGAFAGSDGVELEGAGTSVDQALDGGLMQHLRGSGFKGKVGDLVTIPTFGKIPAQTMAIAGLGERGSLDDGVIRKAMGAAARRLQERATVAVALPRANGAGAAAEGFLLGSYRFGHYKSDDSPSKLERVFILDGEARAIERASVLAEATWIARDLTNEPSSTLTPEALAERAREIADVAGIECDVWDEKQLEKKGFGGVLGVAAGSQKPPRFITFRYAPKGAAQKVAIVGKGITYDSGGLSLKDASSMETMKTDMAGAAAVLGTMSALGKLQPSVEVLGFVPTTENMPGGRAIKPGDVITHYGGKTTEVLNTDAEGRLVLADAIAYASEQSPAAIVDIATLTGSIMVALGKKATGLFSNDEALTQELLRAGDRAGERLWSMPLFDDYKKELESDIADMKNVGSRWGGAIIAALFLREFVGDDISWAHLDIAGAARADSDYEEKVKGGTGVAVRTLVTWIEGRAA
jgi:leucyl aminopeptidase